MELVADAIARALEMPLSERQERHSHILATLSQNSSDVWGARFLQSLEQLEVLGSDEEFLAAVRDMKASGLRVLPPRHFAHWHAPSTSAYATSRSPVDQLLIAN